MHYIIKFLHRARFLFRVSKAVDIQFGR